MNIVITDLKDCMDMADAVRQLYIDAFPPEERRPWDKFKELLESEPSFDVHVVTADGAFAGFISIWSLRDVCYGEHFATLQSLRGAGIGGAVLDEILKQLPKPFVGEVEPPETSDVAKRRIGFYARHGLHTFDDYDYIQPPYSPELPSVRLLLMSNDREIDLDATTREIHERVYGVCRGA